MDSPNCINAGEINIFPYCALRLTDIFSNIFEHVISKPEELLNQIVVDLELKQIEVEY